MNFVRVEGDSDDIYYKDTAIYCHRLCSMATLWWYRGFIMTAGCKGEQPLPYPAGMFFMWLLSQLIRASHSLLSLASR